MTVFDPHLLSPTPTETEAATSAPTGPTRSAYAQAQAVQQRERAWQWALNLIETRLGPLHRQRLEATWRNRAAPWLSGLIPLLPFQPSNLPTFQLANLSLRRQVVAWAGAIALVLNLSAPPLLSLALDSVRAGPEFRVNTYTTGNQLYSRVALDADGDFVIVWHSYGQDDNLIGVYAQRYNATGVAQGTEFQVNTFTTGNQFVPSVALDTDGDFVVAWTSNSQDGSYYNIYAQRYNAAGLAQGTEFRVNTHTTGFQYFPSVALDADGDFVIAWDSYGQDGSYVGVYTQRYNAAGLTQGTEFRVNTFTINSQAYPSVAMDADGDFVVAWHSGTQDGSDAGIYAQRYNAAGLTQGTEFRVNTFTINSQAYPSVAMDADGDFVVAWHSGTQDGSDAGIYAQRYNAAGLAQGTEFRVNTFTINSQAYPSVAMDADGDFVVAWHSYDQDSIGKGIYAQRYNAAGLAQGTEFRVNTYTANQATLPSVALDADGDFVVSWNSNIQDGSDAGIYAQRYNMAVLAQSTYLPLILKAAP